MVRKSLQLVGLLAVLAGGTIGVYEYQQHASLQAALEREQQRSAELKKIVQRLGVENRVAEIIVTDQHPSGSKLYTSILFVENGRNGDALPPKHFTVEGDEIHIDAMVVKFEGKFVEQDDPLRGHSIALFTRLFGRSQSPEDAFMIDEPGHVPAFYRGADPHVSKFEQELWSNFWRLVDDQSYRQEMGVRVAQGEGVWLKFEPDHLYTLTLEANGGLNIRSEPLKAIYREALKLTTKPAENQAR
jgi:hypothetical protein